MKRALAAVLALAVVAVAAGVAAVTQPFVAPLRSAPPAVDSARLAAHVRHLLVDLHPRRHDEPRRLDAAAAYIAAEFAAAGAAVSEQAFSVEGRRMRNLVARFGPADGPLLVVGAHYDSHGDTPGADDNASGVAGLIELARLLAAAPQRRPVELVAYTLEEPPFFRTPDMGSARHARELRRSGRAVRLMLALEMIGYFSDAPGSQHYPLPGMTALYPDRGDFIALVGRLGDFDAMRRTKALMAGATALPVRSINAPPLLDGIDFSDHLNYWAEGLPAIMVTDTAFMRNLQYHEPGDTAERLDYRRMAQVVQAVYAVTQHD